METRISVTEETRKELARLAASSIEHIAALQLIDLEIGKVLENDANSQGIASIVTGYDFKTHEFLTAPPNIATEEGKKALASMLGVDEVIGTELP